MISNSLWDVREDPLPESYLWGPLSKSDNDYAGQYGTYLVNVSLINAPEGSSKRFNFRDEQKIGEQDSPPINVRSYYRH